MKDDKKKPAAEISKELFLMPASILLIVNISYRLGSSIQGFSVVLGKNAKYGT